MSLFASRSSLESKPSMGTETEAKAKAATGAIASSSFYSRGELMEEIPLEPIVFLPTSATPFSKFELVRGDANVTLTADPTSIMLYPSLQTSETMPLFDTLQSSFDYIHYPNRAALPKLPTRGPMVLSRHATPRPSLTPSQPSPLSSSPSSSPSSQNLHQHQNSNDSAIHYQETHLHVDSPRSMAMERTFGSVTIV